MAFQEPDAVRLWGWNVQGDIGPLTIYTSRRRQVVVFDKAPPLEPASYTQLVMRNRWRLAARAWQALTASNRSAWEEATQKGKLMLTGYNLWIWWITKQQRGALETIVRQTGVNLFEEGAQ